MKKLSLGVGVILTIIFTFSYWIFSSNEKSAGNYSELAKRTGLKYELVKPKVKKKLYNSIGKRGPSSIPSLYSNTDDARTLEAELGNSSVSTLAPKKKKTKIKRRNPSTYAGSSYAPQADYFDPNYAQAIKEQIKDKNNPSKDDEEKTYTYAKSVQSTEEESSTESEDEASQSSGPNNNVVVIPKIQGEIPPLNGLITKTDNGLLSSNVYAAVTCIDPRIELFDLVTMTPLEDNPITFNGVDQSTAFTFDVRELGLESSTPARYKVKITGCSEELEKVVTSYYRPQNITAVSSLLAKITNTDITYNPTEEFALYLEEAENIITNKIDQSTLDYATVYSELENSTDVAVVFAEITEGENVQILKEAAPRIQSLTIPEILHEDLNSDLANDERNAGLNPNTFTTSAVHWDTDYTLAYQWILNDGTTTQTVSNSNTWLYIPPADSAPNVTVTLRIGRKNAGDANVDTTIPHHEFSYSLDVVLYNDAPTLAANQAVNVTEDTVHNFTLTEGYDVDSPSINYILTSTPTNGSLSCVTDTNNCTYTPNADYVGPDSFTYKVNDGELDSTEATVDLTVLNVNDAPVVAANQSFTTPEDNSISLTISQASDIDNTQASLSYKITNSTTNGVITNCITTGTYGQDLTCDYTPNANFNGSDSFTYVANDGALDSATSATVSFTITPVNDAPTLAVTQAESTDEDTQLSFNLNAGSDIEGTTLNYTILSSTSNGVLSCSQGTLRDCTYDPNTNFNGTDSFTYKVDDGELDSTTATVTITVNSINDAPVMAADQSITTDEDTAINFILNGATDVDGDTLTYKVVTPPANGVLSNCITTGSYASDIDCTYTPNANFNGSDSFTYIAFDSITDATTTATISLTINPINDAPTLALTQTVSTNEDTPLNFTLNAGADIESDPLDYIIVSGPADGTLSCTGGTSRDCTYTPDLNFNGSTTFTYKVNDGALDSTTATVTINVTSENDAPVMVGDQSETIAEDNVLTLTLNGATDVDLPAQTLQYKLITAPANGTLTNCIATGSYSTDVTCTYTPNLNFNGVDTFTYRGNDTLTDSSTDSTVTINVTPINDAPTLASTQSVTTAEDTPLNFNLNTGSDIEGSTLSYIIVSNPADGTLSCTGGNSTACTYTPDLNYNGPTTFTYKVNDGALDSNIATVTVNVTAVNDVPVMGANQSISTNEDTAVNFTLNNATDVDGDALTYKLVTAPTNGSLTNCITTTYGTDLSCTYTPNANYNGSDSFTYIATDGTGTAVTNATVNLTINPINDAPTLVASQSVSTNEDTPLTFDLTAGADIDGDTLSYIKVTNPASGTVSCAGGTSRSCTYTPALNFNGTTSFTYKVNDGALDSTTATVNITINSINDAPVMAADQSFITDDNTALSITLSNASDVDGDPLTYKIVSSPSNGTLTNCITTGSYGTDLTCTYTSNVNFNGTDTFTFIANDGSLDATTMETVTITVNDKTPSAAPAIALTSATYTNSTANNMTVSSCNDISQVLINEGTQPAAGDAGWVSCTTTASATTYTLASTTQGLHILKAWSKDPNGNVSTSSNDLYVYYDTINPTLALTTPTIQKGGNSINLTWDATDASTSSSQNFSVDFYNGSTWSSLGTTAAINGPISSQTFTKAWTVPSINTTTARFRVSFTDLAGNSSTVQSNVFTIDSIAPALSYSSPANNSYHLSSTTITGNCETGRDINISGDIQANFTIACSSGTFSQTVNFSDGDGSKVVTLNQVDAAGNSTTISRTFIRDEVAPVMTKTAGISPDFTNQNTPNAWSGTCEGNYTIYVTGDETTSFNCSSGTWSWTPSPKTADGTYVYNLVQTDAAGNTSSPALSLAWERDATPPAFQATVPFEINIGQNPTEIRYTDSITVSGSCEGNNTIAISNQETDTISCSAANWSWTSQTYTTDATRTFTFTQSDSAGNTSTLSYTWTRDSNFPALAIDTATIKNNGSTATFTGTCENGLTINISGAQTTTTTCSSGVWSWTTATTAADLSNNYNFAQTNASSNTTNVSGTWIRETGLPVVTSISTTEPDPSPTNFIPYTINANSQNSNVYITELCLKTNDTTAPAAGDECWLGLNSPSIGMSPAANVTIVDFSHLLGWQPANYNVYAWVKDEAGNISTNTTTLNTDYNAIGYTRFDPPSIWDVAAANSDTTSIPPTRLDSSVPTGSDVYIRWKVDDILGLDSTAINLYYTQDEKTFTAIAGAQGIAPQTNHGCPSITLDTNEGCYKWTGGSPLATSYKVRVKVTNTSAISTQLISTPLNADKIKIIAGNTEAGLGGDARTALFFNKTVGDSVDINSLVFTDDGNIYFADYKRGILTVDPADGKQKLFITTTGTSTGDGGPAESATLRYPLKIALDYQGRLLIYDYNRIRRVDLNMDNPTIETIIGGGSNTADTVTNPLDLQLTHNGTWEYRTNAMLFTPLPNGDIWFNSERAESIETAGSFRVRVYKASTGQVESLYLGGTGDGWQATQDLSKCRIGYIGLKYNTSTSVIEGMTGHAYHHKNFPGCDMYTSTSDYTYARVYFDPTTGQAITPFDNSYRWYHYYNYTGMDGNSYVTVARSYVNRNNFDGTYTRILGSGTRGECADGTPATSCNMDIYSVFVTKTGKIYFNDRGRIRTLDGDGNVVTIFGQGYGYGDGVNAVNARFADISRVVRLNTGDIVVNDTRSYYIKQFTPDGNINIVAGNGTIASQDTTTQADVQPVRNAYWMMVDRATGNIYSDRDTHYGRMAMLNRGTGLWEDILYNTGGTPYYDPTSDGMIGADIDTDGNNNRGLPLGFANGQLFMNRMSYNPTTQRYEDFMLKKYDSTDSYRQSHIMGKIGYENSGESCSALQSGPVDGSTCFYEYWDDFRNIFYDSNANRYIMAKMYRGAQRRVIALNSNGTVEQIAYTPRNIDDGFTYARRSGVDYMYYCNGSRLYAHNLTTNTDLGALPWTMTGFNCRGVQFDYNPVNDSVIFPFEQNGLYGVAEYFLD